MKKILKWTGFFKPENYIDIFAMSGKIDNLNIFKKRFDSYLTRMLPIILFISIIISLIINSFLIFFILMIIIILILGIFEKIIDDMGFSFLKNDFKKILKKDFNLKDKNLFLFVSDYFYEIRELNMNKKETISFLKDWEENKKIMSHKRIKCFKHEIKNKKEDIAELNNKINILKED